MLKQVPYNNKLIPIGNAPVYEGKPVYTDGQVAYGWLYTPQRQNGGAVRDFSGFWVGEQGQIATGRNWYKLANEKTLRLNHKILSGGHFDLQCYPCYAMIQDTGGYPPEYGALFMDNGAYTFNGAVIAMAENGSLLTYDDYTLNFYGVPGNQRQDINDYPLYYGYINIIENNQLLYGGWVFVSKHSNNNSNNNNNNNNNNSNNNNSNNNSIDDYFIYDLDNIQIARYRFINDEWLLYYDYDGQQYTGPGTIELSYEKPLLAVECTQILLQQLHSLDYVTMDGIVAVDGLRLDIDATDTRAGLIPQHERGNNIRKYFQLAKTTECYLTALTPDKDANGNSLLTGQYYISYTSTKSGTGYIVEQSHYTGDYTITYNQTTLTGTGIIGYENGGIQIYDNNNNLIAETNGSNGIIVTNVYTGPGSIEVTNVTNVLDKITVYELNYDSDNNPIPGNIIANTNNALNDITVYEQGQQVYSGPGTINISYETPIRSVKRYKISSQNGLQQQQYPAEWQAGTDVKLKLSTMDLEITIQQQGVTTVVTVTNDPLGLLATQGFIFAGGVHANGINVISQDTGLIWQYVDNAQPLTETYAGITNCFNLALLKRRWK